MGWVFRPTRPVLGFYGETSWPSSRLEPTLSGLRVCSCATVGPTSFGVSAVLSAFEPSRIGKQDRRERIHPLPRAFVLSHPPIVAIIATIPKITVTTATTRAATTSLRSIDEAILGTNTFEAPDSCVGGARLRACGEPGKWRERSVGQAGLRQDGRTPKLQMTIHSKGFSDAEMSVAQVYDVFCAALLETYHLSGPSWEDIYPGPLVAHSVARCKNRVCTSGRSVENSLRPLLKTKSKKAIGR